MWKIVSNQPIRLKVIGLNPIKYNKIINKNKIFPTSSTTVKTDNQWFSFAR